MRRRLLGTVFTGSKTVAPEVRHALDELDELALQRPFLAQPITLLREILPAMYGRLPTESVTLRRPADENLPIRDVDTTGNGRFSRASAGKNSSADRLTQCAAVEKLRNGTPLLRGEPLSIDEHQFRDRWQAICGAVQRHQLAPSAAQLVRVWDQQGWSVEQLVNEVLAGNIHHVRSRAQSAGLDPELMATAIRLTLFPTLSHVAAVVAPWLSAVGWAHGSCPTCGSWPLLAEFRGLEQLRYLRCGLCATGWEFPRLECPFCATRDHKLLGYFHVDGEVAKYRAATCDGCRGYVKTVSTLTALSGPQLLVTDVATMHLDLAAVVRGYDVPARSENY